MNDEDIDQLGEIDPDINLLNEVVPLETCKYYTVEDLNDLEIISESCKFLNYNVRSFHANGDKLISMLNNLKFDFDCIVLSETWNTANNIDLCNIHGYESFHTFRPEGHIYSMSGGISVFCKNSSIRQPAKNETLSICNANIETSVVDVLYGRVKLTIVAVYRPPQGCKLEFIRELDHILSMVNTYSNKMIFLGDQNLNLLDIEDSRVHDYASMLYTKSLVPLINRPTRLSNDNNISDTILDHIWTNHFDIASCGVVDYDVTDHLPTFCNLNFINPNIDDEKIRIQSRPYSDANLLKLCSELDNVDWDGILPYGDPNRCCDIFSEKLDYLYTKCFPLKVKYVSNKRLKNRWLTQDIKRLINAKSEACKKRRMGIITRAENNVIKNRINSQVKYAKNKYYSDSFQIYRKNMKKSWSILQELMGRKKSKTEIITILDNDVEQTCPQNITEIFANFFSTIGSNLDLSLENNELSPLSYIDRNPHTFRLFYATSDEVLQTISKLKITRTNIDRIPVKLFKNVKHSICSPLMKIINSSFEYATFPQSLKVAKITPIFKKGNPKLCSNYRPISSLPFLSKIYERLMANRILSFFQKHSLFSEKQFGFLKKKSTKDALYDFSENIYDALNARKNNISVLIDLKSAFDTVNHSILLSKLEMYGIRGHGLKWIESYLQNRKFYVGINDIHSSTQTVNIGIPQGSILGPIFFIIYNNDLPLVSSKLSTTLFADDTNFSISNDNYREMISVLNQELGKVYDWTISNRLTINTSKTELLIFTNLQNLHFNDEVVLNGTTLQYVDNARFLGVIVDKKMNFKLHIQTINNKISKSCGIFYKIKGNMPTSTRLMYYNSFILPYLTFNIIHWGNTNETHLNPLYLTQKRIVRNLGDAGYSDHTTPLFFRFKILKLHDLYKYYAALYTFEEMMNGKYKRQHCVNTRHVDIATPKFQRLSRTQQSISYSGPTIYNTLPPYIRKISSLNKFKLELREYLLKQYAPYESHTG